jgi:uncharacterized RDD family membrane protein YckC
MVTRRCPCGYETRAAFRAGKAEPGAEEPVITVESHTAATESETAKWRSQLERKFEPAREKDPDIEEAQRRVDDIVRPQISGLRQARKGEVGSTAGRSGPPGLASEVVPREEPAEASVLSGPRRPAQKTLSLEPLIAEVRKPRPEEDAKSVVSKEILFSRILAGILDLLLPVATAVLFVFAACWFLNLDFFSPSATYSWLVLALGFYFFNSLYFFWSAGRTPGMSAAELQLCGEDSEDPPFASVVIRIVLFLPVVATLVGLVVALFDGECRALHDRLSKTKIVAG